MAPLTPIILKENQMEFVILLIWVLLSWGVGALASSRGRSGIGFGLLSFITSPLIGVIVVLVIKDLEAEKDREYSAKRDHEKQLESIKAIAQSSGSNSALTRNIADARPFSVADELIKLGELKEKGLLTEDEFSAQKQLLLANS
jgi:hypothetical protein